MWGISKLISWFAVCMWLVAFCEEHGKLTVPDIFLLGSAKAGTTTFDAMLAIHPEICNGTLKEQFFFDGGYWDNGYDWYTRRYAGARNCVGNKYIVDSTPLYLYGDIVPDRVKQSYHPVDLAKKKFLVILREPVSRAFSWYNHMLRACIPKMERFVNSSKPSPVYMESTNSTVMGYAKEKICVHLCPVIGCKDVPLAAARDVKGQLDTFDQHVMRREETIKHDGAYVKQIRNWLRVIKREQLFVVNSETFVSQAADTLHRVAQFLNLSSDWGKEVHLPHSNGGHDIGAFISCRTHDALHAYFDPLNTELYNLLNHAPGKPPSEPFFPPFTSSREMCRD